MADGFSVCTTLGASGGVDLSNTGEVVVEQDMASDQLAQCAGVSSWETVDKGRELSKRH